jgi:hypothetical protein
MPDMTISTPVGRVSALSKQTTLETANNQKERALAEAQAQMATGKLSSQYSHEAIAGKTRLVLGSEQGKIEADNLKSRLNTIESRLNRSYAVDQRLLQIANEVRTRSMKALDPSSQDTAYSDFCKNKLTEVENLLNSRDIENRTLFGGAKTNSKAVDVSLAAIPAAGDTPDASYNQYFIGEEGTHTMQLKEGDTLEYGFSAADDGPRDLIFWLKMGTATNPDRDGTSVNTQKLQAIVEGLGDTSRSLTITQQALGSQMSRLESIRANNEDDIAYHTEIIAGYTDADLMSAFIRQVQESAQQNLMQMAYMRETRMLDQLINNI